MSIPFHDPVPRERSAGIAGIPSVCYIYFARAPIRVMASGDPLPSDGTGRGRGGGQADYLQYLATSPTTPA